MLPNQLDDLESYEPEDMAGSVPNIDQSYSTVQKKRIRTLRETCDSRPWLRSNVYKGHNSTNYYYSKKYGFVYCKVPKSGSTFWTQVFSILTKGAKTAHDTFSAKRMSIHASSGKFATSFKFVAEVPAIIVSRDPFSRLYSGFVDKIYLMLTWKIANSVRRSSKTGLKPGACAKDVSFQEFLEYIIRKVRSGGTLNRHWAPIVSLCRPCDVNSTFLVKQESFATDVEFILNTIGIEDKKLKLIFAALHEHRIEYTIPGIIETAFIHTKGIRKCLSAENLVTRLWKSFQIQGYIRDDRNLPVSQFPSKNGYTDPKHVSKVFMEAISNDKLTSSEAKLQRKKALVDAYKSVDATVIENIREIYKIDMASFDYDLSPPVTI